MNKIKAGLLAMLVAVPTVASAAEQAPGNRLMFSPHERQVALPHGGQDILALGMLGAFLVLGFVQLRARATRTSALSVFGGALLFYGAWVLHKWTISGGMVILYGHVLCVAIAMLGLAFGTRGLLGLARECKVQEANPSTVRLLLFSVLLVLGLTTGTATIFEAGPTIFGIDAAPHQIAMMVVLGACASTAAIVAFVRGICRA